MGTKLDPANVFPKKAVPFVDVTDDCWVWTGDTKISQGREQPRYGTNSAHSFVARYNQLNVSMGLMLWPACENVRCVHPDHLALPHSVVGRMLFIKERSVAEGDCLIWKGSVRNGSPIFPWRKPGRSAHSNYSVHRFVYTEEHGERPPHSSAVSLTCGNQLCVSHKHIRYTVLGLGRKCPQGHELPPQYDTFCPTCRYAATRVMSECPRGHEIPPEEAADTGRKGCRYCRREDADAWITERNKALLESER